LRRNDRTTGLGCVLRRAMCQELKFDQASAKIDEQIPNVAFSTADNRRPPDSEVRRILLSQYFDERANENPLNAVLEAYIAIERWYDRVLIDRNIDNFEGTRKLSVAEMAGIAVEKDLLPASTLNLIDGLTVMRSLALAGPPDRVTPDQAREFLSLADGTLYALDTELRKSGK